MSNFPAYFNPPMWIILSAFNASALRYQPGRWGRRLPDYKGVPYKGKDNDGIPDGGEAAHGLNPDDASDAATITKSGYSNIELYLNSVVDIKTVIPVTPAKK